MRLGSLIFDDADVEHVVEVLICCFCCAIDCKVLPNIPSTEKGEFLLKIV